jgi:hypothetical protein
VIFIEVEKEVVSFGQDLRLGSDRTKTGAKNLCPWPSFLFITLSNNVTVMWLSKKKVDRISRVFTVSCYLHLTSQNYFFLCS